VVAIIISKSFFSTIIILKPKAKGLSKQSHPSAQIYSTSSFSIMSRPKAQTKQQSRVDDLWARIESEPIELDSDLSETTVLFVGDSGCGKTTLINSFLKANSSKQPKPTYALDYAFARKKNSSGSGQGKSVAHIWELGGDIKEPGLLDVPISARNIKTLSIVICCDLSKPHNILMSLRQWIKLVREVISRKTAEHNTAHPESPFEMDEARIAQYAAHPDERIVSLSKVPVYVVATKYDIFKDMGSVERRAASQILRFACHYYGATLATTSSNDAGLRENFKVFINGVCFRTGIKQCHDVHHERPLHITCGKDTFESILLGSRSPDGAPESQPAKGGKVRPQCVSLAMLFVYCDVLIANAVAFECEFWYIDLSWFVLVVLFSRVLRILRLIFRASCRVTGLLRSAGTGKTSTNLITAMHVCLVGSRL
jgi:GTPase SAR1 family protein